MDGAHFHPIFSRAVPYPPQAIFPTHAQKNGRPIDVRFLAQKEGFEPSLRLSHTTPLAGEPLEPLGYFCNAPFFKAILLYHIFLVLSKLFTQKQKTFQKNLYCP